MFLVIFLFCFFSCFLWLLFCPTLWSFFVFGVIFVFIFATFVPFFVHFVSLFDTFCVFGIILCQFLIILCLFVVISYRGSGPRASNPSMVGHFTSCYIVFLGIQTSMCVHIHSHMVRLGLFSTVYPLSHLSLLILLLLYCNLM